MNLPNKLTLLRVFMIPFFIFFMLFQPDSAIYRVIALVIFCIASLTDMLDGKIARTKKNRTEDEKAFGTGRLVDKLNELREEPQKDTLEKVHHDIVKFVGEAEQFDDITMLGFTYMGSEADDV